MFGNIGMASSSINHHKSDDFNTVDLSKAKVMDKHINELAIPVRMKLCTRMNPKDPLGRDWRHLAQCFGFDADTIIDFSSDKNPTDAVLTVWGQEATSTIGKLHKILKEQVKRNDAVKLLDEL